ncbi:MULTISPECIES: restriction endonuclease subunit S [unclassified Nocardioides]|uniref:restriction endonuclease subunit S n=1 Tax=unclassified Nocardioides TaxID=2615069 RepID=UPI003613057D
MTRARQSTGDNWCPSLPADWNYLPLRRLGQVVGGGTPPADDANWGGEIPFITPPDLRPVVGAEVVTTDRSVTLGAAQANSSLVPSGTVLMSVRAPIGYVARTVTTVAFNQGCRALVPSARMDPGYLTYALVAATPEFVAQGRGTTFMEVSGAQFAAVRCPVPPISEQREIAAYLDRETAKVDNLIAEQQGLVDVLRERRAAVIERAVFRGLSDAPRSDRDIAWLPPVPTPWKVLQLGHVTNTLAGWAFPSDGFSTDASHVRLLRGINIKPGRVDWTDVVRWDPDFSGASAEFLLATDDILLGMDRPFVSGGVRIAFVGEHDLPAYLLQRVLRIRPTDAADRAYLRYLFQTHAFFDYLNPLFTGVSIPHVSEWQVRKFLMPCPPVDEQREIADYLNEQVERIDALIEEATGIVAVAKERRSALIKAAVTGQIDVRGEVA